MKFYSDIAENYNYIFPYNEQQKLFTYNHLGEKPLNASILDIGCATGGLTFELSKNVKKVIGIDLDTEMINYAKNRFSKYKSKLRFICDNMMNVDNYFNLTSLDCIVSFGNTIVHLQTENEVKKLFHKIRNCLNASGYFLFQIINYDRILNKKISSLPTIENEHIKFERRYNYIGNNMIEFKTNLVIKKTGKNQKNKVTLLPLQKNTLEKILKENGFNKISYYGNFKRDPLNDESMQLIVAASAATLP
jgi:glycine/sarcosine N-methyltransferase